MLAPSISDLTRFPDPEVAIASGFATQPVVRPLAPAPERVDARPASAAKARDLRLDFFRGLALLFIYLDHIPGNVAGWLTIRNVGFSDATEIFVFISGFAAMLAYGGVLARHGSLVAGARVLHRVWRLYVAHIFLFVVFTAQIAYVAARFDNPMYAEEMNLVGFLEAPHVNLLQALALRFRPANMDILPLYIVLLAVFAFALPAVRRYPNAALAASGVLYVVANHFNWNFTGYPDGSPWVFNPICWQFLFVLGAWFALRRGGPSIVARFEPWITYVAVAYLAFAFLVVLGWHVPALEALVPDRLARLLYPIDKPNMDVLRLAHFLALAHVVLRVVRPDTRFLSSVPARPILWCGQASLQVFCLGTFLAFTGHFYLVQIDGSIAAQVWVSTMGVAAMILTGAFLHWYRRAERQVKTAPAKEEA